MWIELTDRFVRRVELVNMDLVRRCEPIRDADTPISVTRLWFSDREKDFMVVIESLAQIKDKISIWRNSR